MFRNRAIFKFQFHSRLKLREHFRKINNFFPSLSCLYLLYNDNKPHSSIRSSIKNSLRSETGFLQKFLYFIFFSTSHIRLMSFLLFHLPLHPFLIAYTVLIVLMSVFHVLVENVFLNNKKKS